MLKSDLSMEISYFRLHHVHDVQIFRTSGLTFWGGDSNSWSSF